MDKSKTYIEMCVHATEIQGLKPQDSLNGSFYYYSLTGYVGTLGNMPLWERPNTDKWFWPPRQDQLQEMVPHIVGNANDNVWTDLSNLHEWGFYGESLSEFWRVLRSGGILVFKCQDSVESAKQYISHVAVMNMAVKQGFYPVDLFILVADNRIIGSTHHNQQHARKYHSYFWVFERATRNVVTYPGVA